MISDFQDIIKDIFRLTREILILDGIGQRRVFRERLKRTLEIYRWYNPN